jgi:hypothetical protein
MGYSLTITQEGCEDTAWAREDEESPLLEAIAKERLMKI